MNPEDAAAESYADEHTADNEWSQLRAAFLAGIEWGRTHHDDGSKIGPCDNRDD